MVSNVHEILEKFRIYIATQFFFRYDFQLSFFVKGLSAFVSQTPTTKHGQNLDYKCLVLPRASQKLMFYRVLPLHLYLIIITFLKYGCDLNFKVSYCVFQKLDF